MNKTFYLFSILILVIFISGCVQKNVQKNTTVDQNTSSVTNVSNISSVTNVSNITIKYNDKFIVANPVDLSQINSISKFRSCAGHDWSGYDTDGTLEWNRSMKHYFEPLSDLKNQLGVIKIYSPSNGTIFLIRDEGSAGASSSSGKEIYISVADSSNWRVVIFHIDPLSGVVEGANVSAGQLIGYANVAGRHDFDIGLNKISWKTEISEAEKQQYRSYNISSFILHGSGKENITVDSIFFHMSDSVYNQFVSKGITFSNIIVSKNDRDANPCVCKDVISCFFDSTLSDSSNWILVKNQ